MESTASLSQFSIPFQRGSKKTCQVCKTQFSFIHREHLCKRCFRSVCQQCSPFKVRSYKADRQHRLHRMCTVCHNQSQNLQKYVKSNHLRWGQDCDLVRLWKKGLISIPAERNLSNLSETIERNNTEGLTQKITISAKNYKEYVEVDSLWKSLNYSFRQLIGVVLDQSKLKEQEAVENINTVMSQVAVRMKNPQKGFSKGLFKPQFMAYVAIFFLLHSSPQNAIFLILQVYKIIDPYIKGERSRKITLQNILSNLSESGCSDMEIYKIESFLQQENLQEYLKKLTLNMTTAQSSIQIINLIITKQSIAELQKGLAYIFSQRKQFLCQSNSENEAIVLDAIRNLSCDNYKKFVKQLSHVKRKQIRANEQQIKIQDRQPSQMSENLNKVLSMPEYTKLVKNSEQLKIRYKNQQDQIVRLKNEIKTLRRQGDRTQKNEQNGQSVGLEEIDDDQQYQTYYEEQEYIDSYEQVSISPVMHRQSSVLSEKFEFTPLPDRGTRFNIYDEDSHDLSRHSFTKHESVFSNNNRNSQGYTFAVQEVLNEDQDRKSTISEEAHKRVMKSIDFNNDQFQNSNQYSQAMLQLKGRNSQNAQFRESREQTINNARNSFMRTGQKALNNNQFDEPLLQRRPIIKTRLVKKQRKKQSNPNENVSKNLINRRTMSRNQVDRLSYQSDKKDDHSASMTDQSMLTELLQKKNQQIGKLRQQMLRMKSDVMEATIKYESSMDKENSQIEERDWRIRESELQISKVSQQNTSLKNMNRLLLLKLDQLSNMVLDKQEQQLQSSMYSECNVGDSRNKSSPNKSRGDINDQTSSKNADQNKSADTKQVAKNITSQFNELSKSEQEQVKKNILKHYMYQNYEDGQECRLI